ncbi:MAG: M23 family metallopeptidase [Oscillospiraceae bacterium]|nr:M23 family metallopeptidase [Oscillospiraceae bacterium]
MDSAELSAQPQLSKLQHKLQEITQLISSTVSATTWAFTDCYDELAPILAVRLREAVIKLQSSFVFDKSIPIKTRTARAGSCVAGGLAVLVLAVAPASALSQISQQSPAVHAVVDQTVASDDILAHGGAFVADIVPVSLALAHNASIVAESFDFGVTLLDEPALQDMPPFIGGYPLSELIEDSGDGTMLIDLSAIALPSEDEAEFNWYDIESPDLELSAISDPPIRSSQNRPMLGTVITLSHTNRSESDDFIFETADSPISTASAGTFIWPTEGRLSSLFGPRNSTVGSTRHLGIDIVAPHGTPIYAADGGEVIVSGWNNSFGLMIKIRHDNGKVTLYAHCSELLVSVGERVGQGQKIARMGRTGRVSGVHLHFEVIVDGTNVDPLLHLPSVAVQ